MALGRSSDRPKGRPRAGELSPRLNSLPEGADWGLEEEGSAKGWVLIEGDQILTHSWDSFWALFGGPGQKWANLVHFLRGNFPHFLKSEGFRESELSLDSRGGYTAPSG